MSIEEMSIHKEHVEANKFFPGNKNSILCYIEFRTEDKWENIFLERKEKTKKNKINQEPKKNNLEIRIDNKKISIESNKNIIHL